VTQGNKTLHMMGTVIELTVEHDDPEPILVEASRRLKSYEVRFSANDPTSELNLINRNAGKKEVCVSSDLYQLIKIGKKHSCQPNSRLNIAIGPLVQAWRIGFNDARVPTPEEITTLLSLTDPNQIVLNEQRQAVYLTRQQMAIDLGSLAKGYFADLLVSYFKEMNVDSALINLGGNLVVYGPCPSRQTGMWKIGIQDPKASRNQYLLTLQLMNHSIVTSGIYERQLISKGKSYHHILDPQTGYPAKTDVASLTILSKRSLDGEIWTTRLFGKKKEEILQELNSLKEIDGIVITTDEEVSYSDGIKHFL